MIPKTSALALLPLLAVLAGPGFAQTSSTGAMALSGAASASLKDQKGNIVGTATFVATPSGVLIDARMTGLPAGAHGFHIHETGKCEGDFTSAGGHFNPDDKMHGFVDGGPHAGDMPNLHVPADGALDIEVAVPGVTLDDGPMGLMDADGSALIIHSDADDYTSQPSGNAGDRIVCGVIETNG